MRVCADERGIYFDCQAVRCLYNMAEEIDGCASMNVPRSCGIIAKKITQREGTGRKCGLTAIGGVLHSTKVECAETNWLLDRIFYRRHRPSCRVNTRGLRRRKNKFTFITITLRHKPRPFNAGACDPAAHIRIQSEEKW